MGDVTQMAGLVKPDVDLSEDGRPALIITCAVLLPLTWVAVGLRAYTRAVLTRTFQIDDYFMVIAQLIFTVTCAMIIEGTRRGLGLHNAAVTDPDDLVAALMWQSIATAIYVLNMIFIKLSIGIFLLRLAVWAAYKWILWISLIVFTLWGVGIFIWNIFQCTPVAKQWDFRIERGTCASPDSIIASAYALSALTVISDWLYALLPVSMVWSVKMTKQAKWTVVAILGLGIFASVATLIRLKFLGKLQDAADLLYSAVDAQVWTIVEPGVAIFASSLATIRPLLRRFHIRGFSSAGRSTAARTQTSEKSTADGGGYAHDCKESARQPSTLATAGVSDLSLDNVDDDADFRRPDAPPAAADADADAPLDSRGRPQRKRPQGRAEPDSLSEIMAMDDGLDLIADDDGGGGLEFAPGDVGPPGDVEAQNQRGLGAPSRT